MTVITKTYYSTLLTNKINNHLKSLKWHMSLPIEQRDLTIEQVLFDKIQNLSSTLYSVTKSEPGTIYELSSEELYNLH